MIRAIELHKEKTDERLNSINFFGKKLLQYFLANGIHQLGLRDII